MVEIAGLRTLVVMAHYDPLGGVAPHALRQMEAWGEVADPLIVVSTADLDADSAAAIESRGRLLRRGNQGYDFFSYKVGLEIAEDLGCYDTVVICNDSYIGPLVPFSQIMEEMHDQPCDFWGLTQTARRTPHVQSFFVAFRPQVVRSRIFSGFWNAMTPVSKRGQVITRYELGLSTTLLSGGFTMGSYFQESESDRRLARARHVWWARKTIGRLPPSRRREAWKVLPFEPWNPMGALADRCLDDGRLPVVKLDTLRYDPYQLDSRRLLSACERRWPDAFAGVREYIDATAHLYRARRGESPGPTAPPPGVRQLIGYAR